MMDQTPRPFEGQMSVVPTAQTVNRIRCFSTTNRVAYLEQTFKPEGLSAGPLKLHLSFWKSHQLCHMTQCSKWVSLCQEQNMDPILVSIRDITNFLPDLFDKGYQYRSINSYRSAKSSTHARVDGFTVGQYPTITRLMAGVANSRSPYLQYSSIGDINIIWAIFKS